MRCQRDRETLPSAVDAENMYQLIPVWCLLLSSHLPPSLKTCCWSHVVFHVEWEATDYLTSNRVNTVLVLDLCCSSHAHPRVSFHSASTAVMECSLPSLQLWEDAKYMGQGSKEPSVNTSIVYCR